MPRSLAPALIAIGVAAQFAVAAPADRIIRGGPIVTVNPAQPAAEAVAIAAGRIVAVGTEAEVMRLADATTEVSDLAGKTLVPGFVDGHSHFCSLIDVLTQALCASPPAGPCRSVADVIEALRQVKERRKLGPGKFVMGFGYDPELLAEKRAPTKQELDAAFPDNPVILVHVSGHGAMLNSRALATYDVTAATPTPAGGVIGREPGSNEPDGLLFETAFLPIFAKVPGPDGDEAIDLLKSGQELYLREGITTAQEGATMKHQMDLLRVLADRGGLALDVVALPFITEIDAVFGGGPPQNEPRYRNRLRIGGVKIVTDGSPQGRTACFTTPYLTDGPSGQKNWRGELSFPQPTLNEWVKKVYDGGATLFVHCNGDAAIDALLEAHRFASNGAPQKPRGTVGIHSQFIRRDQLEKYAAWSITPSFFTIHAFYFGDTHVANRGRAQADAISPMKSARALGMRPANHTDFNVAPLDQIFTMHTAVNRTSRSGLTIGAGERITPLEALEAITIDGARLYGEESEKGSIEVGKLADLVVLSANPLAVAPAAIETIRVAETIKEGKTVWTQAPPAAAAVIYTGGDILTMRGPEPEQVEAVAVQDGRITFVGSRAAALERCGPSATVVDLAGKTMLPGFIDTHGHFVYFGKNLVDADLFGCRDIPDLIARMKKQAERTPAGAWIVGFGYQPRQMREARTPTIAELDSVAADRPVMIVDSSGHLGAGNSGVFAAAGISAATPDPTGGSFARTADGRSLAGPMEETALNAVRSRRPAFTGELADAVITGAANLWASHGQTTAMEAGLGLGSDDVGIVLNAIDKRLLPIDLYVAAKDSAVDDTLAAAYGVASAFNPKPDGTLEQLRAARADLDDRYVNRVRLGGIKFWLDGSLDTAWFTKPYAANPPGRTGAYAGFRQIPDEVIDAAFDRFWPTEMQIHMHMNGDAAADQALAAIAKAVRKHGMRDARPVFVHASWLRPDQIEKVKACGAIPSFLPSGIVAGGDGVVKLWGPERAAGAMATRTFLRAGLPFTFSHDAPVSPQPWILALVDAGTNRRSASGQVIGPDERISPYDGLRAVTAMAAYQLKEEKTKGTLEPGKLADLVILEQNPLRVDPLTIKDIAVAETIKEGKTVWRRGTGGGGR
jgi:predicted amidohydrolase YtcJ